MTTTMSTHFMYECCQLKKNQHDLPALWEDHLNVCDNPIGVQTVCFLLVRNYLKFFLCFFLFSFHYYSLIFVNTSINNRWNLINHLHRSSYIHNVHIWCIRVTIRWIMLVSVADTRTWTRWCWWRWWCVNAAGCMCCIQWCGRWHTGHTGIDARIKWTKWCWR